MISYMYFCRADVNKSDNFKWTPLHHAAHSGMLDVVQAIVDAGGAINAESITKATPLMRAIECSSFPVCEYLVNKGAKVSHENISGLEPLTVAAEFADPRIYHLINEKVGAAGGGKQKSGAKKKTGSAGSTKRPHTGNRSARTDAVIKFNKINIFLIYISYYLGCTSNDSTNPSWTPTTTWFIVTCCC